MHSLVNSFKCFSSFSKKLSKQKNSHPDSLWQIYQYQKQTEITHTHELKADIPDEQRCKDSQQNPSEENPETHQRYHTPQPDRIHPRMQRWFNICKLINITHHVNKIKKHIVISIDVEKTFDKIQHPFMKQKTCHQSGI